MRGISYNRCFLREYEVKIVMLLIILGCVAGCYKVAPGEGEISTVPVTNNPNAMPGPMKSSPMPSVF